MVTKFTLIKKLSSYSVLATVVTAAAHEASAQIVYHDVKPDTLILNGGIYSIDLNVDDTVDFKVGLFSFTTYSFSRLAKGANVWGEQGDSVEQNTTGAGSFYRFAQVNKYNAGISKHDVWKTSAILDSGIDGTFSNRNYFAGKGDRYIGLKLNKLNKTYYGWVRVSLSKKCDTLIVRDYAYNATLGDSIKAGEGTTGIDVVSNNIVSIAAFNPNPAINNTTLVYNLYAEASVSIELCDIMGRKIETLLNYSYQIPGRYKIPTDVSQLSSGVYLYSLTVNGQTYTQKLVVEH